MWPGIVVLKLGVEKLSYEEKIWVSKKIEVQNSYLAKFSLLLSFNVSILLIKFSLFAYFNWQDQSMELTLRQYEARICLED